MGSMSKQEVKCRCCGHKILAREIMRTDLYERAPGQNYVYVKFRCRRCKRLGQTFVPEARWDWSLLEPAKDELSDNERDRLGEAGPISEGELLNFSAELSNLDDLTLLRRETTSENPTNPTFNEAPRLNLKPERKDEKRKNDLKGNGETRPNDAQPSDARPDDSGSNG